MKPKKKLEERKQKTIPTLLDEIAHDICDNYCKFPDAYPWDDDSQERLWAEHCDNCPLNQLT